jgi:RimJ/RimL family protein N-acetyltransferase
VELVDLVLTGDRLELRPWTAEDADDVVAIMADGSLHRFLALPQPYTAEDAQRYVTQLAVTPRVAGTGLECAVVERATGRLVGSAALRLGPDPEIGYWVAPFAQRRGYAAEATRTLAEWAFAIGLPRVGLLCVVGNLASARVALAAGFAFEGVSRNGFVGGGYGDVPERRGDLARFGRLAGDSGLPIAAAFAPLPAEGLADDVLELRPARPEDAPSLTQCEDSVTAEWSFFGRPKSAAEVEVATERAALEWLVGSMAYLAMVDRATGRVAGSVQLRKAGPPDVGGVGYVVHPDFRGRRYTTRALRLLADWAFEEGGFARLELGAKVGNEASVRAAAAAGWTADGRREARLRNGDGSFSDELRYALINPKIART